MRIKKVNINKYGPLEDINLEPSRGFHLYFGENESGKTLLVDAMIKMMIGDANGGFPQLSRVDQFPAGSLVLETGDGDEIVLPSEGFNAIAKYVGFEDFSVEDLRNTFIIRDVDLRRPNRKDFEQSEYFRRLTDSLLGVETQKIKDIRKELQGIGYLTNPSSDSILRDRKEDGHLKKRKEKAEELLEDIRGYREECKQENIVEKFSKKKELDQKISKAEERLELLEGAKKGVKLEEGRKLVEELEETREEEKNLDKKKEEIEEYRSVKSDAEDVIERKESGKLRPRHYKTGFIASSILLVASLIGTVFAFTLILAFLPFFFAVPLSCFAVKLYSGWRLEKEASDTVKKANRLGIEVGTLSKISDGAERRITKFEGGKSNLQERKGEIRGNLQRMFGGQGEKPDYWKEKVEDFGEKEVDEEIEEEYDEREENNLRDSIEEWNKESKELEESLKKHLNQIQDFNRKISNIFIGWSIDDVMGRSLDTDEVRIKSVGDLGLAVELLEEFLRKINTKVKYSRKAIAILEDLESEEEQVISKLLDGDGYALSFFENVTDGNYVDLGYDEDEGVVKVTRVDGEELTPNELSQSTYDLLYMAIRISLARELMGDEAGFQILDTPFMQSDSNRIESEMKLLEELSEDGWNIIYFTFRKSVKEAIANSLGSDVIEELPPLKFDKV